MTLTEKLWHSFDSDHDGHVTHDDVTAATKKYKKSIPRAVVEGLEEAFRDKVRTSSPDLRE